MNRILDSDWYSKTRIITDKSRIVKIIWADFVEFQSNRDNRFDTFFRPPNRRDRSVRISVFDDWIAGIEPIFEFSQIDGDRVAQECLENSSAYHLQIHSFLTVGHGGKRSFSKSLRFDLAVRRSRSLYRLIFSEGSCAKWNSSPHSGQFGYSVIRHSSVRIVWLYTSARDVG